MKHKLIIALLASSSLLFSDSIVATWTIDKVKAEKLFKAPASDEMEQFIIALMVEVMTDIEFRKDGSCQITTKNRTKCWKKSSDSIYILYEEDGSDKGTKVKIIDTKNMEIIVNEPKFKFAFTRTNKEN
jgi:hypothetical protein